MYSSRIIGTGSFHPPTRVTNEDLADRIDTSNRWIVERTGIRERRVCQPNQPSEFNSSLAFEAAQRALQMAGKTAQEIDQIVYATSTPDTLIPSTACWLQKKLQADRAWAVDLNAACSGFVFALATADQFIQTGKIKTSLVVGADVLTAFTDWTDRSSCILFGDAAGAVVIEQVPKDSEHRILSTHLQTDGSLSDLFLIPAGGSNLEITPEVYQKKLHKMQMKGKEIFKAAVKTLADYALLALEANQVSLKDLDWFIPHQANLRIIEAVSKRLGLPFEKILVNVDRYGNTSSASVPAALDDAVREQKIKPGQLVLLDVFGAGLTYGSVLIRW